MAERSSAPRKPRRQITRIEHTPSEQTQLIRAQCKYVSLVVDGVYEPHELAQWDDPDWKKEHFVYDADGVDKGVNDPPPPASSAPLDHFERVRREPGLQGVIDEGRGDINSLLASLNHEDRLRQVEGIHSWFTGFSAKAAQESEHLQQLVEAVEAKEATAHISRDRAMQAEQAASERTDKIVNFVQSMQGTVGSGGSLAIGAVAQRRHKKAYEHWVKARDAAHEAKIKNQEQLDELANLKRDVFGKIMEQNTEDKEGQRFFQELQNEVKDRRAKVAKLTEEIEDKQAHAAELKRLIENIRKSVEEGVELELQSGHPLAKLLNVSKKNAETNEAVIQRLYPTIEKAEQQAQHDGLAASKLKHKTIDLEKVIGSREEVLGIINNHHDADGDKNDASDPDEFDEDAHESDLEYVPEADLKRELTQAVTKLREKREQLDGLARQRQEMSATLLRCEELRLATRKHLAHLAACMMMDENEFQQEKPCPPNADGPERLLPSQWRRELDSNWQQSQLTAELYATLMLACSRGPSAAVQPMISLPTLHQKNNAKRISFLNAQRVKLCSQEGHAAESLHDVLRDAENHWTHLLSLESSLTPAWQSPEQVERLQGLVAHADPDHLWLHEDQESRIRMSSINKDQQRLMKEANLALLKLSREARIDQVAQLAGDVVQSKKRPSEINVGRRPPAPSPSSRGAARHPSLFTNKHGRVQGRRETLR